MSSASTWRKGECDGDRGIWPRGAYRADLRGFGRGRLRRVARVLRRARAGIGRLIRRTRDRMETHFPGESAGYRAARDRLRRITPAIPLIAASRSPRTVSESPTQDISPPLPRPSDLKAPRVCGVWPIKHPSLVQFDSRNAAHERDGSSARFPWAAEWEPILIGERRIPRVITQWVKWPSVRGSIR